MSSLDEMASRLSVVAQTLHWVADECKKQPTSTRIVQVLDALLTTEAALPMLNAAKALGVPYDTDDVRQSLASTLINALATGCIVAGSQLGYDVERFASNPGPELSVEWQGRLESLYGSVAHMRDAIVTRDAETAWMIGSEVFG